MHIGERSKAKISYVKSGQQRNLLTDNIHDPDYDDDDNVGNRSGSLGETWSVQK